MRSFYLNKFTIIVWSPYNAKQPAISIYYGDVNKLMVGVTEVPSQEAVGLIVVRES